MVTSILAIHYSARMLSQAYIFGIKRLYLGLGRVPLNPLAHCHDIIDMVHMCMCIYFYLSIIQKVKEMQISWSKLLLIPAIVSLSHDLSVQ